MNRWDEKIRYVAKKWEGGQSKGVTAQQAYAHRAYTGEIIRIVN